MLHVNGTTHQLSLDPRLTLLDTLRDVIGLTGTKKGCDQGACGACTVIIDDQRVLSCLTLAVACEGHDVVTIEGLAEDDELHPMQAAFLHCDAFQCGYCTPGQILSAICAIREVQDGVPSHVTPLGTKGVGELATTGMPAAIANAVYHATGTRVRSLPIAIEKVLGYEQGA